MTDSQSERSSAGPDQAPLTALQSVLRSVVGSLQRLSERPPALIGTLILLGFVAVALLAPALAPYSYKTIVRNEERRAVKEQAPGASYAIGYPIVGSELYPRNVRSRLGYIAGLRGNITFVLGTDWQGRDVYSRLLWGARDVLILPGMAAAISVALGAGIGALIGFRGGWLDELISRLLETLLAIPALILALVLLAAQPGGDAGGSAELGLLLVIVAIYTPIVARVIRSATIAVRTSGYVEEARLRGESTLYIVFREIFPSVLPALVVEGALRFSYAIFLTASLGFLGLGVSPASPEWGATINQARRAGTFTITPWAIWTPVVAIATLIISINLMSDGLRRILRYEGQLT